MPKKICEKCGKKFEGGPLSHLCPECNDLSGQTFGRWKVLERAGKKNGREYYLCECICGTRKEVYCYHLISGISKSCGCFRREAMKDRHLQNSADMIGKTFHELTVLERAGIKENCILWKCRCSCGKIVEVTAYNLTSGRVKSCGHLVFQKIKNVSDCGTNLALISSSKLGSRNKSGVKGVYFDSRKQKWMAEIMFQRKKHRLGQYDEKEDAVKARQIAEENLHGEFLKWYEETHGKRWGKSAAHQAQVGTENE